MVHYNNNLKLTYYKVITFLHSLRQEDLHVFVDVGLYRFERNLSSELLVGVEVCLVHFPIERQCPKHLLPMILEQHLHCQVVCNRGATTRASDNGRGKCLPHKCKDAPIGRFRRRPSTIISKNPLELAHAKNKRPETIQFTL